MPNKAQVIIITLLRLALGWLFFYAGYTKVINPACSAAGYLGSAKTFGGFYGWLASDAVVGFTNFLNQWGLTLIGLALIFGALVKIASYCGALMMFLYYLPILQFPKVGTHSMIVDEHIMYILVFLTLAFYGAGKYYGLDAKLAKVKFFEKIV